MEDQIHVTTETRRRLPQPNDPNREPIINSPYGIPDWSWQLDSSTKAYAPALPGRRESQNIPPVAGSRRLRGRPTLPGEMGARWIPLQLVNDIRAAVLNWEEEGYPGITQTSRNLINHWTDEEACQPYFAQLDAVLTHIYLHEAAPEELRQRIADINAKYNDSIHRIAHKMATATGKTPVMAMLVLYHAANHRNAAPDDHRFTRRFLVVTPGLTVRERLQDSLDPGHDDSDWKAFNLVPPGDQWEQALSSASVNVINHHQMQPKDVEPTSTKQQQLIDGGSGRTTQQELEARKETPQDVIDRIADGKSQQGRILAINDEGHHCHRGDPDRSAPPRNTQWFQGIRQIRDAGMLQYVVDMSATPIFLAQSNPRPFDWIVSDYSLIDAIEAGLTKIPRVPTSTNRSNESQLRDIFSHTDSKQAADFRPDVTGNNPLLKEALNSLYRDYEDTTQGWRQLGRPEPPVMAIVMNSVRNANAMFRHVAGGAVTPLLSNYEGQLKDEIRDDPRTIIVHSKMEDGEAATGQTGRYIRELAEVFRRNPRYGFSDSDRPEEIIRRVMNTVGRPGQPGENVRCVISVNMLTEGWNTKTVTHLLGFRKFGSSLLCEQVAGRTLRRVTLTKDDDETRFIPEYAQILGIPFPQYAEPDPDPNGKEKKRFPPVTVEPDPERRHLRVEWPNIIQLRRTGGSRPVEVRAKPEGTDEIHEVPAHISERINVEPTAGETARFRGDPPVTATRFIYLVASAVVKTIELEMEEHDRAGDNDAPIIQLGSLFSQTVNAGQKYHRKGWLTGPENQDRWASDEMAVRSTSEWLHRNVQVIKPDRSGVQMEAEGSAIVPWLHTGLLRPYDIGNNPARVYGPTKKSEITYADCDSSWEVALAHHLDEMDEITRWARNKGLNWSIPYVVDRQQKRYWPDFVAVASLSEGLELNIVIETKGLVREYDPTKRRWAQEYWVPAVNRHPEYGVAAGKLWTYLYLDSEALVVQAQERIRVLIENARKG